jgi:hypothetical protein
MLARINRRPAMAVAKLAHATNLHRQTRHSKSNRKRPFPNRKNGTDFSNIFHSRSDLLNEMKLQESILF